MSKLKEILSMSRHERHGALAVLAIMAIIIAMMWVGKECSSTETQTDSKALQQWAEQADSSRQEAARIDSIAKANKAAKRETHKKKGQTGKSANKSNKKKSRPLPPRGLPDVIPNY